MVDITFNLIVFFLVASQLNDLQAADLHLPVADAARPPAPDERAGDSLCVNVLADGELRVHGRSYAATPAAARADRPWVGGALALEAASRPREADDGAGPPCSALRLHIRPDRDARFGFVAGVLQACEEPGIVKTTWVCDPEGGAR